MTADLSPLDIRLTEHVLDTAVRLFTRRDARDVGMPAIAREADVDLDVLRRHFPTKLDLVYAVTTRSTRALVTRQIAADRPDEPPVRRLSVLIRSHIEFSWEHRTEEELRRGLLRTLRVIYPDRHREMTRHLRRYREHIGEIIAAGREAGTFAPAHPGGSAGTVLETLDGILNWYEPAGGLTITELGDVYVDLIIHHQLRAPRS
ncbi:TetR/AcrR family transcriptional regulator [Marinitenerispora sediminis]|uniref:TetR family transcriptional regulator n=2 Tax=Marinitenerispora sediminis TaxID=1931232 RepID=A0A368T261_9ACTN|nr:TetR/AcrR family transcriptional regulator [Marinitenerispora sediminis]RCV49795.1 TetR family transcriptional regulator [Marinitenerispora sediminis]RCV50210.1 TetR family transcriptional regulator [Marinitenerispora sediminis]RCV55214.1 TetR family transcriptional regulator [Marinitenerispora sediminis]